MADFEWDEAKREANRLKHGLDFSRAIGLFDGRPIVSFSALSGDEARLVTVGVIAGKFCTVSGLGAMSGAGSFRSGGLAMKSSGSIVSYTAAEIDEMIARGEDKSDWAKADAMTEAELEAAIASDPDEAGMVVDWSKPITGIPAPPKEALSIRLDPDIIDFFRQGGRGYQTRINAVLRSYVDQARNKAG